jgi:hypothetical protein
LYFVAKYSVALCLEMVAAAKAALVKAMEAESYSIGGRSLSRARVADCQKELDLWLNRLDAAENGTSSNGKPRTRSIIAHV